MYVKEDSDILDISSLISQRCSELTSILYETLVWCWLRKLIIGANLFSYITHCAVLQLVHCTAAVHQLLSSFLLLFVWLFALPKTMLTPTEKLQQKHFLFLIMFGFTLTGKLLVHLQQGEGAVFHLIAIIFTSPVSCVRWCTHSKTESREKTLVQT